MTDHKRYADAIQRLRESVWIAEQEADRFRVTLHATLAEAFDAGVPAARLRDYGGWKQSKSVYDAIKMHRKAAEEGER